MMTSLRERLQAAEPRRPSKPVCTCGTPVMWGAIIPPPPCEYHDPPVTR